MPSAKAKKVTITLKSISDSGHGAPDVMELITEGTFKPIKLGNADGWEISYEDSEATGFAGSTTTVTCIGNELASIRRSGSADSHLVIEKDRRHHCHYGTEYGDMLLGISASRIINRLSEEGGVLYFKYTIDINSAFVSENEIYFEVSFD
ncbi:MAG: DUF1934 domain-containing protein [Oscillospiraceae bacterium]|nr:DUF1934 domain-containing protein [Oscillospiraceae bacterium]MDD7278152.1 DUF1934 domain-containing protein [Oscillospiraceae bacterium]MDY2864833.1 DUF1934 domain-containing protein [Oscillospiraceae bacterium]